MIRLRTLATATAGMTWAAVLGLGGLRAWRNPAMRPPRLPNRRPPEWLVPGAGAALAVAVPVGAVLADRSRLARAVLVVAAVPGSLVPLFELYRRSVRHVRVRQEGTVLVLGCGIRGSEPTAVLASRLEKALEIAGSDTEILVSGGLGDGETATEASVMANWLRDKGRDEIRTEGRSTCTDENLDFSRELVRTEPVTVVTSDFHVYRVRSMIRERGLDWSVVGAPTPVGYWATGIFREFLGLIVRYPLIILAVTGVWGAVNFHGDNAISFGRNR